MAKFITMEEFAEKVNTKRPDVIKEMEYTELEFQLIKQIIDLRIKKNLTQQELAYKANLQQFQISKIERGQLGNVETLMKVLHALGVSIKLVEEEMIMKT